MTKKPSESVQKYGQRVKALIQKLTNDIAQSVQVEWYVAEFRKRWDSRSAITSGHTSGGDGGSSKLQKFSSIAPEVSVEG